MSQAATGRSDSEVWGAYVNYDDVARLTYGRMLWRNPAMRERLLAHWLDKRHPGHARFLKMRAWVEEAFTATVADDALDRRFRARGSGLRCVIREIPPVFGSFFE